MTAATVGVEEENPGLVLASTSFEEVKSPMAEEPKLSFDDIKSPVEVVESPAEEVKSQAKDDKSPAEEVESPAKDDKSPTEEVESPAEDDKSPVEEVESPVEDDESPAEEVGSPVEDKSPAEEVKSPAEKISAPKEEEDPVSSSTPSKPASPEAEEVVEDADSVDGALHLSGYFFSLEDRLSASLLDLVYWRQPVKSGCVFFSLFFFLLAFTIFTALSVVSHVALMVLAASFSYVGFKRVAAAVQKSGEGHPFQEMLDHDISALLCVDDVQDVIQASIGHVIHLADVLRGLLLIVNVFDSCKLGLFLYALTYVGEAFNLLTIFIIALVILFTVPKTYEVYGADMDLVAEKLMAQALAQWPVIKEQVVDRIMMIKEKAIAAIPIGKDKAA